MAVADQLRVQSAQGESFPHKASRAHLDLCSVKSAGGLNSGINLLGGVILSYRGPPSTHLTFSTNWALDFY